MTKSKDIFIREKIRNKFRDLFERGGIKEEMESILLNPNNLELAKKLGVNVPFFVK